MLQKRQASKTVDINTFSSNVNIATDPVSERRRQIALQVSLISDFRVTLIRNTQLNISSRFERVSDIRCNRDQSSRSLEKLKLWGGGLSRILPLIAPNRPVRQREIAA